MQQPEPHHSSTFSTITVASENVLAL